MILNRFFIIYYNNSSEVNEINDNEINKFKELLLMQDTVKIYFTKKLINFNDNETENSNLNEKIVNFYFFYTDYINENCKNIYEIYNNDYHLLIKKYLNIIIEIIIISNQNVITKSNNYSPNKLKRYIKSTISNIIKFYYHFPDKDLNKNKYILDIIKFFIDKSLDFHFSEEKNNNNNIDDSENNRIFDGEGELTENDFIEFYIEKYKIDREILLDDSKDNKNKSVISNFYVQSPMLLLVLLKLLYNYNIFLKPYLNFILFLCKINQQNILFLLRQKLLKILFNILKEIPYFSDIIFQIFKFSFKYLEKEDICFVFEQIIKLSNNIVTNNDNKDFIKELLHYLTISLRVLSISNNDYFKGVILSRYKIKQPNLYNMLEINDIKFYDDNNMDIQSNSNILVKQEIYFYKSLKTKKLLLLRFEKEKNSITHKDSFKEIFRKYYLEISLRNYEILISENNGHKYDDLSNYNSIFIDNDNDNDKEKTNIQNYLNIYQNNTIIYIFKQNKKLLSIYINGHRVISYKYSFDFNGSINIKIGFPLDLVKKVYDNKFKLFNHIKIKSFKIFLQNNETKETISNIYKLTISKISCDYLFADELTNF